MPSWLSGTSSSGDAQRAGRRSPGFVAWVALATVLGGAALLVHDAGVLEWRPERAWRQPWRFWTAAWVHYGDAHLRINVAGAALIGALGVVARLPARAAVAWALAWPLTHAALLLRPSISYYGGLSGVLHAGVAVAAVALWFDGSKQRRLGASALVAGLLLKTAFEQPWRTELAASPALGIRVVPFAHAAGIAAGLASAWLLQAAQARRAEAAEGPKSRSTD